MSWGSVINLQHTLIHNCETAQHQHPWLSWNIIPSDSEVAFYVTLSILPRTNMGNGWKWQDVKTFLDIWITAIAATFQTDPKRQATSLVLLSILGWFGAKKYHVGQVSHRSCSEKKKKLFRWVIFCTPCWGGMAQEMGDLLFDKSHRGWNQRKKDISNKYPTRSTHSTYHGSRPGTFHHIIFGHHWNKRFMILSPN